MLGIYGLSNEDFKTGTPRRIMSIFEKLSLGFKTAAIIFVAAAALGVSLSGCASSDPPPTLQHTGMNCVDDSSHCIGQREKAFDSLMADKSRAWVKQPAHPAAYASGVRLFALSKKRKELSCEELAMGRREADGAPQVLRGSGGQGLTPAQVSRGIMLAGEVGRELSREFDKRCKRT